MYVLLFLDSIKIRNSQVSWNQYKQNLILTNKNSINIPCIKYTWETRKLHYLQSHEFQ